MPAELLIPLILSACTQIAYIPLACILAVLPVQLGGRLCHRRWFQDERKSYLACWGITAAAMAGVLCWASAAASLRESLNTPPSQQTPISLSELAPFYRSATTKKEDVDSADTKTEDAVARFISESDSPYPAFGRIKVDRKHLRLEKDLNTDLTRLLLLQNSRRTATGELYRMTEEDENILCRLSEFCAKIRLEHLRKAYEPALIETGQAGSALKHLALVFLFSFLLSAWWAYHSIVIIPVHPSLAAYRAPGAINRHSKHRQ